MKNKNYRERLKTCKKAILAAMTIAFMCLLSACNNMGNAGENHLDTGGQGRHIGQDKEVAGCYKRISIAKDGETYEEMKEMLDIMYRGYLVVNDDGTALFDLDGDITEYVFDKRNFYLSDDTEMADGFPYTYIGGRLVVDDGITVTQYLRLTDEELASCLESCGGKKDTR